MNIYIYWLHWKLPVLVSFCRWIDATKPLYTNIGLSAEVRCVTQFSFKITNKNMNNLTKHQIAISRTHTHKTSQKPWKEFWDVLQTSRILFSKKKVGSSVGDGLSTWGACFFKYLSDHCGRSGALTGNFGWNFYPYSSWYSLRDPGSPSENATVNNRIMQHFLIVDPYKLHLLSFACWVLGKNQQKSPNGGETCWWIPW